MQETTFLASFFARCDLFDAKIGIFIDIYTY